MAYEYSTFLYGILVRFW